MKEIKITSNGQMKKLVSFSCIPIGIPIASYRNSYSILLSFICFYRVRVRIII